MPSTTSNVGGLTLPVPAGVTNASFADPTVAGLIDYVAFCLGNDLDAKLSQMMGTSHEAVPAANRYTWDPDTTLVRGGFPALYMWWDGRSRCFPWTQLYDVRERRINALYVFQELVTPTGRKARTGILPAVDASWHKAAERGRHPLYTPPSGTHAGQDILTALSLVKWAYEGAQGGEMMAKVPEGAAQTGGAPTGHITYAYPALRGSFLVWERVDQDTLLDPDDVMGDVHIHINASDGESNDVVPDFLERVMQGPDGSE